MSIAEFSHLVALHDIGNRSNHHSITARPAELAALANRFGLARLDQLSAELDVRQDASGIRVTGKVSGHAVQICVVSGADVPVAIDEAVDLLFARISTTGIDEIELSTPDLDVLPLDGESIDLGEVAADTLGLSLDPFPHGSETEIAEARIGLIDEDVAARIAAEDSASRNPFRVLKGGKDD